MNTPPKVFVHPNGNIEVEGFGVFGDTGSVEVEILKLLISILGMSSAGCDSSDVRKRLAQYIEDNPSAKELFHPEEEKNNA